MNPWRRPRPTQGRSAGKQEEDTQSLMKILKAFRELKGAPISCMTSTYLHGLPVECLRPGFMALNEGEEEMTTQFLWGFHLQERVHEQTETLIVDILQQP